MRDRDGILTTSKAVLDNVRQTKSGLLVGSSACTMFSVWQNLNQYRVRQGEWDGRVWRARVHIIFCTILVPGANVLQLVTRGGLKVDGHERSTHSDC